MLALTRRPNQGFRFYWCGELIGELRVRPGLYPGETKCLFDCDRRLDIQREELPPRDGTPPPHHPVREEFDAYLDDGDDATACNEFAAGIDARSSAGGEAAPE